MFGFLKSCDFPHTEFAHVHLDQSEATCVLSGGHLSFIIDFLKLYQLCLTRYNKYFYLNSSIYSGRISVHFYQTVHTKLLALWWWTWLPWLLWWKEL